jgi:hypothetical protein
MARISSGGIPATPSGYPGTERDITWRWFCWPSTCFEECGAGNRCEYPQHRHWQDSFSAMSTSIPPTSDQVATVVKDYAQAAKSDYVGLWQICIRVRHDFPGGDSEQLRRAVLKVVEGLLAGGLEAVDLASSGSGCVPWQDQRAASVLSRISSKWNELGRDPSVGEIAWFDNPDTGVRS